MSVLILGPIFARKILSVAARSFGNIYNVPGR
jgi:hypothetical protein